MVRINSNLILSDHLPPTWQIHQSTFLQLWLLK